MAEAAADGDAVLGPATDGGWWVLALGDASAAAVLAGVPMSRPDTFDATRSALVAAGQTVRVGPELTDVDTVDEAVGQVAAQVAGSLTGGHFLQAWRTVTA